MTVRREFLAAEVLTHFGETSWENVALKSALKSKRPGRNRDALFYEIKYTTS